MKKIFWVTLMFNAFVSPFLLLELRKPQASFEIIEPVDTDAICEGLENVEYREEFPEFVDICSYTDTIKTHDERVALQKEINENPTDKWKYYDMLKEDDFIKEPSFYGYSYELTPEERDLVERTVMHEAGWCPDYRLLILTAQCFRNDCEINGWQPAEAFENCGYAKMSYANPRAVKAVRDVFDEGIRCVPEKIFCYYNRNMVYSADHEKHRLAIEINGSRFFY